LAIIHPQAALKAITPGTAAHELPDAASAGAGNGERMKSRLGLKPDKSDPGGRLLVSRIETIMSW